MAIINFRDGRPIYEQIADHYKQLILAGVMEADEQMPSVRALAMELSTNPNTVQKAYGELERSGYIYSVSGRGNFVSDNTALRRAHREELIDETARLLSDANMIGFDAKELYEEALKRAKL